MPQKFLSPGVFTTEYDKSFLAQGVAGIGATIIGRTLKGPAFKPINVVGFNDFVDRFGETDYKHQMPYAAQNYLRNATSMTAVRVLGHSDGTSVTNGYSYGSTVGISDTGSLTGGDTTGSILCSIHCHVSASGATVVQVSGDVNRFVFKLIGSGILFAATASFLTSSEDYIEKVLNTDPTKWGTYYHYLYANYKYTKPVGNGTWACVHMSGADDTVPKSFLRNYTAGVTSYVKSQPVGGIEFNLFRFHTLGDGRATNDDVKVEISNVKPSPSPNTYPYGTFDVIVRKFYDTDQRPEAIETFTGVCLDVDSKNYIARRIGDINEVFDTTQRKFITESGMFPNKSKYIRVEMVSTQNAPSTALPWGHRGYNKMAYNSASIVDDMLLQPDQLDKQGNYDAKIKWGICYVSGGIADRMRAEPDVTVSLLTTDSDFSLKFLSGTYSNGVQRYSYNTATPSYLLHTPIYASASMYGFVMPFSGGFDGWDLRLEDPLYLGNSITETSTGGYAASTGGGQAVVSVKRALDTVANPDVIDMNLLAIPGIHNLKITDYARTLVNDRADALYIMDITGSSVVDAVNNLKNREIDDNYTAVYYPDVKIDDKNANRIVRVAPSVAVVGAMAFSDRTSQPFFAPAGLNRGGLNQFDVIDVADRLTFQNRNDLYDNRINPIASFPNEGVCVFGQRTLQIEASQLDRINVRRLLIYAKKTVASAAKYLLFEPNDAGTWQIFVNTVNPIFEKVRQGRGLERFKVVMDSTTNTDDVIERNIMAGKIFLQPTKISEFIDISFVITSAGVEFGE